MAREAGRLVANCYTPFILILPNADRLENLGLTSLENRRIKSDLIETYKIITGYYNIKASFVFFFNLIGWKKRSFKEII